MNSPPDDTEQALQAALGLHRAGRFDEAAAAYRAVLGVQPDHARALHSLGVLEKSRGDAQLAVDLIERAIALHPDAPEFHNNLGDALATLCRWDDAAAAFRHAIVIAPDYVKAYSNLAPVLIRLGRFSEAVDVLEEAVTRQPDYARGWANLGSALTQCGWQLEALDCYRRALTLDPNYSIAHSNLLMGLNYIETNPQTVFEAHRHWAGQFADPLTAVAKRHISHDRDPERRLRIGYVSGDFKDHAVSSFFLPVLDRHDREQFHVTCYSNVIGPDAVTAYVRQRADEWRDIAPLSDDRAADLIREDRIDLLIDLAGHSARNRLLLFARKPAPVQATWLGYPNTTGMAAIDWRVTDGHADPPGMTESLHTERLARLTSCWCYSASTGAPPVAPPPGSRGAPPTFGSFNTLAKITPAHIALWARLLREVGDSRLMLKAPAAGDERVRERLWMQFETYGIERPRVTLLGREPDPRRHLELYAQVDVVLDAYPYHGTTMTCEALWMGVPVVTLAGKSHVSRVGVSLLSSIGLPELIARSEEEYITIGAALVCDVPRLTRLRETLRWKMTASPLLDAEHFTREIEGAYRAMWRDCLSAPSH